MFPAEFKSTIYRNGCSQTSDISHHTVSAPSIAANFIYMTSYVHTHVHVQCSKSVMLTM